MRSVSTLSAASNGGARVKKVAASSCTTASSDRGKEGIERAHRRKQRELQRSNELSRQLQGTS